MAMMMPEMNIKFVSFMYSLPTWSVVMMPEEKQNKVLIHLGTELTFTVVQSWEGAHGYVWYWNSVIPREFGVTYGGQWQVAWVV